MKVLAESAWSWMLLADGDSRILSVLCGTIGLFELVILLSPSECPADSIDRQALDALAARISYSPESYLDRHRPELLDSESARAAIETWRRHRATLT
ncbi:MAG: hypothetical protein AB7E72_19715 [Lysobacterales bacterium]